MDTENVKRSLRVVTENLILINVAPELQESHIDDRDLKELAFSDH